MACPAAASWPRAPARSSARSAASGPAQPARRRGEGRCRGAPSAPPRARAAAAASGAGPTERLTFTTPQPQPGGTAREYWIEARDALWDVVPSRPRRDEWHGRAVAGPSVYRAFVYQQITDGFAAPLAARRSRARRSTPRSATRSSCTSATPARADRPGGDHAPARRQVQPGVRRRLPGRLHPRRRLRRPGRGVHLHVGGDARCGRRLALPRPRPQPHAEHLPRALRRDHRPRARREAARRRGRASSSTRFPPPGHRPRRASSTASTAAPSPATRRRCGPRSARTSPCT